MSMFIIFISFPRVICTQAGTRVMVWAEREVGDNDNTLLPSLNENHVE